MTRPMRPAAAEVLRRLLPRHSGVAVTAALLVAVLTGCGTSAGNGSERPHGDDNTVTATDVPAEPNWPTLKESGTGSSVVSFTRPDERARYLEVNFTCTAGTSRVELRENPRVSMSGTCGTGQGYQMNLPPGVDDLHLDITIDPAATFEMRGRFIEE